MVPVSDFIEAFNAHDHDRALGCLAPDFVMEVPPGKVRLPSREAAGAAWECQFRKSPALRIEVIHRSQVGPCTIQEQRPVGMNVPGRLAEQHMVEIFRVLDGQIAVAVILPA